MNEMFSNRVFQVIGNILEIYNIHGQFVEVHDPSKYQKSSNIEKTDGKVQSQKY